MSGLFLSFFFTGNEQTAFTTVNFFIENDVFCGYLVRLTHLNLASAFFIRIYIHLFRNLFIKSSFKSMVWCSGVGLLLILILTAFIGYVLPWGQISFWGANVITRFLTVVPFIGTRLVNELWRGFSIGQNMLSFFFSLHFLFPFAIVAIILFHLVFLHLNLSSNKLFTIKSVNKMPFNIILLCQDMINLLLIFFFLIFILAYPFFFDDEENSKLANEIRSPIHIKPEWYFLFAYAILRSIPNKLGGVIAIGLRILYLFAFIYKKPKIQSTKSTLIIICFLLTCLMLTWIGGNPVEAPYIIIGQLLLILYFSTLLT